MLNNLNRELNHTYLKLHSAKEQSFWALYMNLSSSLPGDFENREKALKAFVSDPSYLPAIRRELAKELGPEERSGLEGWQRFFMVNAMEDPAARALAAEIVMMEGELGRRRRSHVLGYQEPQTGQWVESGFAKLLLMVRNDPREEYRKAAWEGLRALEGFVLENGFLDLVKKRNALGRLLGYEDYYDYRVQTQEGFSKKVLFSLLEELEVQTRNPMTRLFKNLSNQGGAEATAAWNAYFYSQQDVIPLIDPYFPVENALSVWGQTFTALGINFQQAVLQLDLLAHRGKYENGFMHGPLPTYVENGVFYPAHLNFTANAVPGQPGGGLRALETLMHEGGHAAHFSNIKMPSPCYSQENPPTSAAFAEVQSMFLASLMEDPDWLTRYARDKNGRSMPEELALWYSGIQHQQLPLTLRSLLVVPLAERALYEIPDKELSSQVVLEVIRKAERKIYLGEEGYRPTLAVPHLLSGESSASYHAYVLAQMGVYQTKSYFLSKYGFIMDNPQVGRELREVYWKPGNSKTFLKFIRDLTGEEFSPQATVAVVATSEKEQQDAGRGAIVRARAHSSSRKAVELGVKDIRMVHGDELAASLEQGGSFEEMAERYAGWLAQQKAP